MILIYVNFINDNINVNAINGHHQWMPLIDAINAVIND
jgi:hypothetical protein